MRYRIRLRVQEARELVLSRRVFQLEQDVPGFDLGAVVVPAGSYVVSSYFSSSFEDEEWCTCEIVSVAGPPVSTEMRPKFERVLMTFEEADMLQDALQHLRYWQMYDAVPSCDRELLDKDIHLLWKLLCKASDAGLVEMTL